MEFHIVDLLKAIIALFVIMDPIGLVPVFVGLTKGMELDRRKRALQVVTTTGSILLFLFALVGRQILQLFGITLSSFMIAGGLLLVILSLQSLLHGTWVDAGTSEDDIGVVPLTFPLLVGPGAITLVMLTLETSGYVVAILSIVIVMFLTWLIFRSIDRIHSLLGKVGSAVVARLMAVFIAAMGVQFVISGLQTLFPGMHP